MMKNLLITILCVLLGYLGYILFFWKIEYHPENFLDFAYVGLFFFTLHKLDKILNDDQEKKKTRYAMIILWGAYSAYICNRFPFY